MHKIEESEKASDEKFPITQDGNADDDTSRLQHQSNSEMERLVHSVKMKSKRNV